jgi:hypothetical protein
MQGETAEYEILKRSFRKHLTPSILSLLSCQISPVIDSLAVSFTLACD